MDRKTIHFAAAVLLLAVVLLISAPVHAAGFAIFEQGSKAMGMAGAFGAQADDPSAMYYNIGGLAMLSESEFYAGVSAVSLGDSDFTGLAPFPGPDATGTQKNQVLFVPHFYYVRPLKENLNLGLAMNAPFGLTTQWKNRDEWAGRFLSEKAALQAIDLTAALGWRAKDNLGLSFGLIVRNSTLELHKRNAAINPFTQTAVDVAMVKLEGGFDQGYGFTAGLFHQPTDRLSWGLNYRSQIDVDYDNGDATFTQILSGDPTFDGIVASILPADQHVDTGIAFPDSATLAVAYKITDDILVEADYIWWGWSSFESLELAFEDEELDTVFTQNYDDSSTYRFGLRWDRSDTQQLRFGFYFEDSPQPSTSTGPLLPDADRQGFTVGYGFTGERFQVDLYVLYVDLSDRTITENRDNFNGSYTGSTLLAGVTVGW